MIVMLRSKAEFCRVGWILESRGVVCVSLGVEGRDGT